MKKAKQLLTAIAPITSPPGFTYVEDNVCICHGLNRDHYPFLQANGITTVVNVSGMENRELEYFGHENKINMHNVLQSFGGSNLSVLVEWVTHVVEMIFSGDESVVLILGSIRDCLHCLVIACLRKFQSWSLVSIIAEMRMLNGNRRMFDMEQFVEIFDPVVLKNKCCHNEKIETRHLQTIFGIDETAGSSDWLDKMLSNASSRDHILSPTCKYDPALSLLNDKDDDD